MYRNIDQWLVPDLFGRPVDMDWLWEDDDDDDEVRHFDRRVYTIPVRATMNTWDDFDFFMRFRITKPTFLMVLQMVEPALQHPNPR